MLNMVYALLKSFLDTLTTYYSYIDFHKKKIVSEKEKTILNVYIITYSLPLKFFGKPCCNLLPMFFGLV